MSAPAKGLDGLLLGGAGESFWGGGGEGEAAAMEETVEWRSLGQRSVAVESCLFVVQVLKAARRRTIGVWWVLDVWWVWRVGVFWELLRL